MGPNERLGQKSRRPEGPAVGTTNPKDNGKPAGHPMSHHADKEMDRVTVPFLTEMRGCPGRLRSWQWVGGGSGSSRDSSRKPLWVSLPGEELAGRPPSLTASPSGPSAVVSWCPGGSCGFQAPPSLTVLFTWQVGRAVAGPGGGQRPFGFSDGLGLWDERRPSVFLHHFCSRLSVRVPRTQRLNPDAHGDGGAGGAFGRRARQEGGGSVNGISALTTRDPGELLVPWPCADTVRRRTSGDQEAGPQQN